MLSKWFKRKSVPSNDGKSPIPAGDKHQYVKVFELELSNMEDAPVYPLTDKLSIGKEIGDILISDPSVSPRHATFLLDQDVISVIDHGSVTGTFINGQKIPPGKYIILEEADVVMVGDLEVRLRTARKTVKVEVEETVEDQAEEDLPEIPEIPEIPEVPEKKPEEKPEPVKPVKKQLPPSQKRTPKKVNSFSSRPSATNALIRVFAIIADFLVAYALLIIFSPFDEFRDLMKFTTDLFYFDVTGLWEMLEKDYGFITRLLKEGYQFLSSLYDFVPLVMMYIFLRLSSTLLFGVTLSQLFLGTKAMGNGIWKRLGGMLRVVLGIFTWPFIIFDIPSVVSKRTFKEVLTFTHLHTASKFLATLGLILYFPLTIILVLFAPLIQGFEPPEPVLVNERLDRRVKVKQPVTEGVEEGAVEQVEVEASSQFLNLKISYDPSELSIIPDFKFRGVKSKLKVSSILVFYQRDLQRPVDVEVFKMFDMKQLLSIGFKGNFFLFEKYPEIYNYVYESKETAASFKKSTDKTSVAFAEEFIQFTKTAFSLSLENVVNVMEEQTLLLKSLIDYKASFLSLIEYKEFSEIGFIKIGNVTFMKISFMKQKPFDLLIPLIKGQGKILKVTFDKKENLGTATNKFYKFNLDQTDWLSEKAPQNPAVFSSLEVFDLFSTDTFKNIFTSGDIAQSLYAFYFEKSARFIQQGDPVEMELWKNKVGNFMKLIEEIPGEEVAEGEEDIKRKLLQNFRDLMDALENNNMEYFGLSPFTTI